jgi:PAS domain S-box-containing protein
VARWGAELRGDGKVVWFEVGDVTGVPLTEAEPGVTSPAADVVMIELLDVPLLLTSAWLEHSGALLREHLLISLDEDDDGAALARHATAGEALALLEEQWPELDLGLDPDELLAGAVEPLVTARRLQLAVPRALVAGFAALDELTEDMLQLADHGQTLTPPTQPEVRALRRWVTGQVRDQTAGSAAEALSVHGGDMLPTRAPVEWDRAEVDGATTACIAADDTDCIIAVSNSALELLGHDRADLVGHRLLAIIPTRFHQAHLAGFTLHLINGRGPLLGVPLTVPVRRRDGSEQPTELTITARSLARGRSAFVAELRAV